MIQRFDKPNLSQPEYLLCRHAKAKHNIRGEKAVFAGGLVDSELAEDGKKEIDNVVKDIVSDGGCNAIICSIMKRSQQTAEIIADELEKKLGIRPLIKVIKNLQEINVGNFTNRTIEYVNKNYPKAAKAFNNGDIINWDFPKGESYKDVTNRCYSVIHQLSKLAKSDQRVVIIGHGMFNRIFLNIIFPARRELWQPAVYPFNKIVAFQIPRALVGKEL